jgi:uncharacterized OB-fold protein
MTLPIINMPSVRAYPPRQSEFTTPFWDALAKGEFKTTQCTKCAKKAFPPKPICPHCWCGEVEWVALSGSGRLYSKTMIHAAPAVFKDEVPYSVGIVDLDEGLRLATRIVGEPELDAPVQIVVLLYEDGPIFGAQPLE